MTVLTWDQVGEKQFQTGVDRGVLYLPSGEGVAWNGLTSVEDSSSGELKASYLDGVKYLETLTPGDFTGSLKAFTYPDEFDLINGVSNIVSGEVIEGLNFHNQPRKSFGLSYRTKVGNDVDGVDHVYKIHLLYNLLADPDNLSFNTLSSQATDPVEFSWSLSSTPPRNVDYAFRPTGHISVDSTKLDASALSSLEDILYGTSSSEPSLPKPEEIIALLGSGA